MAGGRSTARRASPCGGGAVANGSVRARCSGSRYGRAHADAPAQGGCGTRSVRADRPEAVRAVHGAVHPRPERHLRLIAARRAHDREVLTVRSVDGPLVAARTTDVLDVVTTVAGGAPTGPAAGAALRIRRESLLRVVLLIGRGVDEVDSTVDAGDRPISVGHGAPPGRVVAWCTCGGRPYRQSGKREVWRKMPGPSDPGADVESLLRGAPVR